jgi:putative hydrolase of the HAD superfamily
MTLRAVAFDLDRTLAVVDRDRAALLEEALTAAGDEALAEDLSREAYLEAHTSNADSETREPIFADLLAEHDADPGVATEAYRRAVAEALVPVDGSEGLLAELRSRYAVGLLTDGPPRAQRTKLRGLGWNDRFDCVVVTGDLGTRKPDPETFATLLDTLGTTPETTAYVGDHPERDVAGAADAGLPAVQVLGPADDPHPAAAAHVRRSEMTATLPAVLERLG